MIKCLFCKTENIENILFCADCGAYLLTDGQKRTASLGTGEVHWNFQEDQDVYIGLPAQKTGPSMIQLKIGDHNRKVEFPLDKTIHLGRLDPASDTFPEVDLTNDGGLEKGVSRHHARLLCKDEQVLVEDLGSVNGTFINDKCLAPYLPELLQDKDYLQIGSLTLEVKLS